MPAALALVKEAKQLISSRHAWHLDITLPLSGFILMDQSSPYVMLAQWNQARQDPLQVLEWLFLPLQPKESAVELYELVADVIIKIQKRCLELAGVNPATVIIPVQQFYVEWALLNSTALQVALASFQGQVQYHHAPHPLLKMTVNLTLRPRQRSQRRPVKGDTVFTGGSGKTGKAAVAWKENGQWHSQIVYQEGSPQVVELQAAALAFQYFPGLLNLVTDSAYVAALLPK